MSRPGELKDSELTDVGNGQRLANMYAPSWLAASEELSKEFGFAPVITVSWGLKIGAYRTRAEQEFISPASPDLSDHCKGRAVDISNQRSFRNVNETKFIQVLAKWGWLNVNTSGFPFPSEPWHFANKSSSPAGGDLIPIEDTTKEENNMILLYNAKTSATPERRGVTEPGVFWREGLTKSQAGSVGEQLRIARNTPKASQGDVTLNVSDEDWDFWKSLTPVDSGSGEVVLPSDLATKTDVDSASRNVIAAIPTTFTAQ